MSLDEPQRDGLDLLDPARSSVLSATEREHVLQEVLARGPGLIRRARRVQVAQRTAVVGCVAAAAALLVMNTSRDPAPSASTLAMAPAPACAADLRDQPPIFRYDEGGRGHLALGERASVVTEPGSELSLVTSNSCATLLALRSGEATVHARDLGGGTLQVDTPYGVVMVHSTRFRVSILASSLVIRVAEGEVSVLRGVETLTVKGDQSLEIDAAGTRKTSLLSAEERRPMQSALILAPSPLGKEDTPDTELKPGLRPRRGQSATRLRLTKATQLPVPAAGTLLAEAESLWRAGEVTKARGLFQVAARDPGPTGEAAWVRLSRLELSRRDAAGALRALQQRQQRKGHGVLEAEARWLEVQALRMSGQTERAEARATELIAAFGASPQALAARRYLEDESTP